MTQHDFRKADQRVAYIMDQLPQARHDYLTLLLLHWRLFDGIQIPDDVFREIVDKATQPETITRSRRKVKERDRLRQYLELQRMAQVEVEVKAPLLGGQPVDRKESKES